MLEGKGWAVKCAELVHHNRTAITVRDQVPFKELHECSVASQSKMFVHNSH